MITLKESKETQCPNSRSRNTPWGGPHVSCSLVALRQSDGLRFISGLLGCVLAIRGWCQEVTALHGHAHPDVDCS